MELLWVAVNSAAIYLFLIFAVRLAGRRQLGQLTPLDLLVLILLGSAVETAMVRANTSLTAGLVSGTTLLLVNRLLTWVMLKSERFRHLVGSGPLLLVHDGKFVDENLKRLGMSKQDVIEAIRERECASIKELRYAVFEPDGEINVVMAETV
ncbi:MAG TPA: YetF domain-containing protein [Fimbriimonadaceae bacterium]|nr:YetF domain-containing protein [Fimbriimonadaceae bacterium]